MKVSSPVGDFPFAISRVELTRDGITVRGLMGAWPARVEVGVSDIPQLAKAIRVRASRRRCWGHLVGGAWVARTARDRGRLIPIWGM